MPYARKRASAGGATRAQVAAAIGARTAARFPYSKYGSAHYLRGSPGSVSKFGSSYRAASPYQRAVRKATGFVGRGKYSLPRFVNDAKLVGSMIGMAEPMANRFITKGIPRAMSAVRDVMKGAFRGRGMYTNNNSLIEGGRSSQTILAPNDESDSIILSDCEYVRDIFAPTISTASGFTPELIEVNPGLQGFAPNLSQIACNYTEYELQQLIFELRPVISENNVNNGQSGIGMMVFNYNPNDDPYDNKEDVMQAHGSVSGRITEAIRCGVECDVRKTNKTKFFVRTGPVPYQKDSDEYDMGVLTIATNNIPSTFSKSQLYELYVHYKVLLRKRKAGAIRLNNQQRDLFVASGNVNWSDLFSSQLITGATGILKSQQNSLGVVLSAPTASTSTVQSLVLTFPSHYSGFVEIKLVLEASSGLAGSPTVDATSGNVSLVSDMFAAGSASDDLASSAIVSLSTTKAVVITHVKVKSSSGQALNVVTINTALTAGAVTQWYCEIAELTQQHWQSKSNNLPVFVNQKDGGVHTLVTNTA